MIPYAFYWAYPDGETASGIFVGMPTKEAIARAASSGASPVYLYHAEEQKDILDDFAKCSYTMAQAMVREKSRLQAPTTE